MATPRSSTRRRACIAALILPLVLTACATPAYVPQPPARYQGDRVATVSFLDPKVVDGHCREIGATPAAGLEIKACHKAGTIVFPNPCAWPESSDLRDLLCHELGHANGWPGSHPET